MDLTHTLRSLRSMPRLFLGGIPKERAGDERLTWRRLGAQLSTELKLTSDTFLDGGAIPKAYSAEGGNHEPPLSWSGVPAAAKTLVLIAEDPDAPTPNPFVHWIVYDIPPQAKGTDDDLMKEARHGRNSMMTTGWTGCAPPKGDSSHRYVFQLFVLDCRLNLGEHPGRTILQRGMRGHILSFTSFTGTYQR